MRPFQRAADFRQIDLSGLIQVHPAKPHLTFWRLEPPSNATVLRVHAIPVRWLDRKRVRRISRTQPLSGDIVATSQTRRRFDMLAFCRSLKRREPKALSVAGKCRAYRTAIHQFYNFTVRGAAPYCSLSII